MISGLVRLRSLLAMACLLTAAGLQSVHAMTVSPIHVEMAALGTSSHTTVTVTNNSAAPMPVETLIEKLSLDETGRRKTSKADDNFLVFPPQAIIPAGGAQVFRLQWVGAPDLAKSESYLLSVEQVPVRLPKGSGKVQMVMNFGVVINVASAQGAPELNLVSTSIVTDKQGKRHPVILVANPSNVHALLPQSQLSIEGAGWSHVFSKGEMDEKIGIGLVQPGHRRKFILPVDLPASVTAVEARLDLKPRH